MGRKGLPLKQTTEKEKIKILVEFSSHYAILPVSPGGEFLNGLFC
jgi:hypothetical protein